MKHVCLALLSTSLLAWILSNTSVSAQSYSINWHKISGGGGSSTGGSIKISGSIGQDDADNRAAGGNNTVTGGFWTFTILQSAGSPRLNIFRTTTNTVVINWPSPSTGWTLHENPNIGNVNGWTSPQENLFDNGTTRYIIVTPAPGHMYYRLSNP